MLAEQKCLHLLPASHHLPTHLAAWTEQTPDITVLECYADLATQGFLTKALQPPQSLPAVLAIFHLHTSCFGSCHEKQPQMPAQQVSDMAQIEGKDMLAGRHHHSGSSNAPQEMMHHSCLSGKDLRRAFEKPPADRAEEGNLGSRLLGLAQRLELSCPADLLCAIQQGPRPIAE